MNQNRFIRNILYRLKRDYGSSADIYYEISDTVDLTTGKRSVIKQKWSVKRAICLPKKVSQDSLLAAAMKELFKRGGNVVIGDRQIIIDRADLPARFRLGTENWYIMIDDHRYQIVSSEAYEVDTAYLVTLKETQGAERVELVEMVVKDRVNLSEASRPPFQYNIPTQLLHDNLRVTQADAPHALKSGTDVSITVTDSLNITSRS